MWMKSKQQRPNDRSEENRKTNTAIDTQPQAAQIEARSERLFCYPLTSSVLPTLGPAAAELTRNPNHSPPNAFNEHDAQPKRAFFPFQLTSSNTEHGLEMCQDGDLTDF